VLHEVVEVAALQRIAAARIMIGVPRSRTCSRRFSPSAVLSSPGWGFGCAEARQCWQARSHACVVSQMTRKGVRS
jgi:hypothetical protein